MAMWYVEFGVVARRFPYYYRGPPTPLSFSLSKTQYLDFLLLKVPPTPFSNLLPLLGYDEIGISDMCPLKGTVLCAS
jgi:hypothetical protein